MPRARAGRRGGEDALVEWLRARPETGGFIGDDTALLPPGGPWTVTVDSQRAGIHFPAELDPAIVARRLLQVNLSDLAAVGAEPRYGLLSLAVPAEVLPRRFLEALLLACRRAGVVLVGGDTSKSSTLEASLTLIGALPRGGRFLTRRGARPGQRLWLGGTIGESALGQRLLARGATMRAGRVVLPHGVPSELEPAARRAVRRHLNPKAQLELGRWLGRRRRSLGAIDVSDGLGRDLHRLCRASRVGARIDARALPRSERFADLAAWLKEEPLQLALGGGEDYVLLFTLPPHQEPPPTWRCWAIGETTRRPGIVLDTGTGTRALPALGWDHLA